MLERPLTTKQQRFTVEYCVDFNGTQAAIRAGYKADRAADMAWKLLKNPNVQAVIDKARRSKLRALEFEINRIGAKQRAKALLSIADFLTIDSDGTMRFKQIQEIDDSRLNDVAMFKTNDDGYVVGLKLVNATQSLQELMKLAEITDTNSCASL